MARKIDRKHKQKRCRLSGSTEIFKTYFWELHLLPSEMSVVISYRLFSILQLMANAEYVKKVASRSLFELCESSLVNFGRVC